MDKYVYELKEAKKFNIGDVVGKIYSTKDDFDFGNAVFAKINGEHGVTLSTRSNRFYFILSGNGFFEIESNKIPVMAKDVIIIPKNKKYNFSGRMEYLLVNTPSFDPKYEIH